VTPSSGHEELVLSIRDVAKVLGVSDDLVYELVARGDIPCIRLGRRRLIPRRAVDLMIERSLETFDVDVLGGQWRGDTRSAGE